MLTGLNTYNGKVQYNNVRFGKRTEPISAAARKVFSEFERLLPKHEASSIGIVNSNVVTDLLRKNREAVPGILEEVATLVEQRGGLDWAVNSFKKLANLHKQRNAKLAQESREGIVHIFI